MKTFQKNNNYFGTFSFEYIPATKEGNVLLNDTLNTLYLRLYGVRHIVEISKEKNCCHHYMGYIFWLAGIFYMNYLTDRIAHIMVFVIPEIADSREIVTEKLLFWYFHFQFWIHIWHKGSSYWKNKNYFDTLIFSFEYIPETGNKYWKTIILILSLSVWNA